ncbi:PREDICTED: protein S-acyltransferase 11-like [Nicotiana attenuata]|uniref:S-acyltransferase n=1 Tax=Nicotiana attenuata TaxID=49451 RepID=A0A1J6IRH4_NICAT|nr:PREDICTED: protein S-acyltransferase 11-like [Nicotiana attenuata]OIT06836.1 protein s-acyltransferase 11 [Nicotiana attenuata]
MDFAASTTTSTATISPSNDVVPQGEHYVRALIEDHETTCWGCGLRVLVPPYAPAFKCFWCGAITNQNAVKIENKNFKWRRLRDRCFVGVLVVFMLFVICGGVWAIYPIVFSISYFCSSVHSLIAVALSISTLSAFSLAAFRSAGAPPDILWGSYPAVKKAGLENYTFCQHCSKPKMPRAHHCRSCGMCILDMDHHCPIIGNCVGASNHRSFIIFLISAIISTIYVSIMSAYAAFHFWPPLSHKPIHLLNEAVGQKLFLRTLKDVIFAFLESTLFVPARGLVLVYLFIASVSILIGLTVLLWQQLCFIYEGKTYLSHISWSEGDETAEKDCQNLIQFFGCSPTTTRFLPIYFSSRKKHKK